MNSKEQALKSLVVYYSVTGNTRRLAGDIAAAMEADIETLHDPRIKPGLRGYLRLAQDAIGHKEATLAPITRDPAVYDLVVLAGPIWSSKMCSPVAVYACRHKHAFKNVALVCTSRSSKEGYAGQCMARFAEAEGMSPIGMLGLGHRDLKSDYSRHISEFVRLLNTHMKDFEKKGDSL